MQCFWAQCVKLGWRACVFERMCVCEREKSCARNSICCLLYVVCTVGKWLKVASQVTLAFFQQWVEIVFSLFSTRSVLWKKASSLFCGMHKFTVYSNAFIPIIYIYLYAFGRCFHPNWHCIQSIYFINSCIPWDSNPWPGIASNILPCLEEHYNWELLFAKRKKERKKERIAVMNYPVLVTVLPPYTLSFRGLKSVRFIFLFFKKKM